MSSESLLVAVQHQLVVAFKSGSYPVVLEALCRVEVEHEQQASSLERDHLVLIVVQAHVLLPVRQPRVLLLQLVHRHVPLVQTVVAQQRVVSQVPPSNRMVVAPPVVLPREIDPLRMPEFVPHEGQVPLPSERKRDQPDHLVVGDSSEHNQGLGYNLAHVVVDFLVEEPHRERLVPDQSLIVALCVADALLQVSPIRQGVGQVLHVPVVVWHLLEQLDPLVWYGHSHSVVKANPAFFD